MKSLLYLLAIVGFITSFVYSASILDYLTLDAEAREEDQSKTCLCNGPSCICCVDFNMSLIDLGGPGCVRLKYLSNEEGIAMNVSYGDSLLHNNTVKPTKDSTPPEPTCLNIFTKLAQMCAKFTELISIGDNELKGCVQLEPMLLGETQIELPIGCFKMGDGYMKMIENSTEVESPPEEEEAKEPEPEEDVKQNDEPEKTPLNVTASDADNLLEGISAADIISAVSQSAEEGISIISKWLGISVAPEKNATTSETEDKPES